MNDYTCYEILNLNNNSTIKDARSNYLKLCLKYHPDKNGGRSEEFVRVNEAYKYYIDNQNNYRVVSLKDCMTTLQCYFLYLGYFLRTDDIVLRLKIDIEDIYNAITKKIVYSRLGMGFQTEKKTLYLELSDFQHEYTLENYGDFNCGLKQYNHLIIKVEVKYPDGMDIHLNDTLSKCDLHYSVRINIYEYYYGIKSDLKYFNDESIKTQGYIPHLSGDILEVEGQGLINSENKRDKLYVFFKVDMKKHNLTEKTRDMVRMLFEGC